MWAGWHNLLPVFREENETWRATYLPRLRAHEAALQAAREEEARRQAEMERALAWCQANGNPHLARPNMEDE